MTYSFQKRKELNSAFIDNFPSVKVSACRDGVPFIHTSSLPASAVVVGDVLTLKELVPVVSFPWKAVIPVLYKIRHLTEDGNFEELFEISYVNCTEKSLAIAAEKVENNNLWFMPMVIRL